MITTLEEGTIREKLAEYFYGPDKGSTEAGRTETFNPSVNHSDILAFRLLSGISSYLTAEQSKLVKQLKTTGKALSEWESGVHTNAELSRNLVETLKFNKDMKAIRKDPSSAGSITASAESKKSSDKNPFGFDPKSLRDAF